jgi:hypothetical protein
MNTGEDITKDAPCPDKSSSLGERDCGLLGSGWSKIWRGAIIVAAVVAAVVLAAHSMLTGSTCGKGDCGGCGGGWGAGVSSCPLDKQYGPHRHRGGFEAVSGGIAGTGSSLAGVSKDRCCALGKDCCGDRKAGRNSGCCPLGAGANCPNNPGGTMKGLCPMAGGVRK